MISIPKNTKGNNFTKIVGGVTIFNLCKMSSHAFICANFREITSKCIKVIEQTQFLY